MDPLHFLRYASALLFGLLAVVCLVRWRREGGKGSLWVAASFGVLAAVLIEEVVLPEDAEGFLSLVHTLAVAVLFLFPYFLYRFTSSFGRPSRVAEITANGLTVLVVGWALLLPFLAGSGGAQPLAVRAFVWTILVQWTVLSILVAWRLWRAGRHEPTPGRRRLRLLSLASLGLSMAVVLAAEVSQTAVVRLVEELLLLTSGALFFLGFSPPRLLRMAWRRPEEEKLQAAIRELMTATREEDVTARLLPHATSIVSGRGAALVDDGGRVVGRHGDTPSDIGQTDAGVSAGGRDPHPHGELRLPLRSGSLVVWTSPYSPFFGQEELKLLESLGALFDLALERVKAETRIAQLGEIVQASSDAIIAQDLEGTITSWNEGAERVYGYTPDEVVGWPISILVPPDRPNEIPGILERIKRGERIQHHETNRRRKDGRIIDVSLSISPRRAGDGRVVGVASIGRDVTERKEAERNLESARLEAERANRAKSEFLSRMSHELRTPLNAILGFAQLLELDDLTEEQRQNVEEIVKGGRHLLELINEVLDITRIEAGKLAISLEPVPVHEVLGEALRLIGPLAHDRRLTITYRDSGCTDQHVLADYQRFKQVLLNLLSNAVKYNVGGGRVDLSCEAPSPERFRISVSDTGKGIPEGDLDRLFLPFERLGAEESGEEGTGLGLPLAKRLMEAMGGTIGVESEPGKGSTFWIELPPIESSVHKARQEIEEPAGDAVLGHRPSRLALYIEDNLSNLKLIEGILSRRPEIELLTAMQGRLGMDLAKQHRPDFILLDLQLPDISGREVLEALKADEATRDIPVVIVSADATSGQIRSLMEAGARAYLTKPLDVQKLLRFLDEELGQDGPPQVSSARA